MQQDKLALICALALSVSSSTIVGGTVMPTLSQAKEVEEIKSKLITKEDIVSNVPIEVLTREVAQLEAEALQLRAEEERLALEEQLRLEEIEAYKEPTYNPYNLLEPSNISREQAYEILEGTALQSVSSMYVYMEELYGLNALWLMAISAEESAWGRSSLAISNNNLGGIKDRTGGWAWFESWGECLEYKADLLYNEYLTVDGSYYNGLSVWNVNRRYCEQQDWADKLNTIAYSLLNKIQ